MDVQPMVTATRKASLIVGNEKIEQIEQETKIWNRGKFGLASNYEMNPKASISCAPHLEGRVNSATKEAYPNG